MIKNTFKWFSMALFNKKHIGDYFEPLIQLLVPSYQFNAYRAKVLQIREENKNVYTLRLKISKKWKGFVAGQFIEIFVEKNGAKYSRFFSLSSSPYLFVSKEIVEITIQKQDSGRITPWLGENLKVGDFINVSSARGDFSIEKDKPLLFIAAGSGITPFKSMLDGYSGKNHIHLMYYAKKSDHLFVDELQELEKSNNLISVSIINSSTEGRISKAHLHSMCSDFSSRLIYVCGPTAMIESTTKLLNANKISIENIKYEYFGAQPLAELSEDIRGVVDFEKSLLKSAINNTNKQTLLEMAESKGLKPRTGCRMGICHQCICQKKRGVVYNTITKSYSDTGNEEVQLCISIPVGDVSLNL